MDLQVAPRNCNGQGLIFAELGRVSGIFSNEIYAGMVMVTALTTLLPPFVMKWSYEQYGAQMQ